jgi:hypothetical protein
VGERAAGGDLGEAGAEAPRRSRLGRRNIICASDSSAFSATPRHARPSAAILLSAVFGLDRLEAFRMLSPASRRPAPRFGAHRRGDGQPGDLDQPLGTLGLEAGDGGGERSRSPRLRASSASSAAYSAVRRSSAASRSARSTPARIWPRPATPLCSAKEPGDVVRGMGLSRAAATAASAACGRQAVLGLPSLVSRATS